MAEESINVPISPEISTSDEIRSRSSEAKPIAVKSRVTKQSDPRRASTGSFNNGGKKFSSGKLSSLSRGESPVPHYLRASTGSCHDFCKHGRKDEAEIKPWQTRAKKLKNPALNQQIVSETGDLSGKNITKLEKSKPPVWKTNSPSPSVSRNKITSPSSESAKNEKNRNVKEKQNATVLSARKESGSGLAILARLVSPKEDTAVNEKKKNIIEKQTVKREIELKPDKKKGTSNEITRNIVSSPVAYLATKPYFNGVLSSKANGNRSKKTISNVKDQNKTAKAENKHLIIDTAKQKTVHARKVENEKTVPNMRKKIHGEIKKVENVPAENEDVPLYEAYSSPNISSPGKSPPLSYVEEAQVELEYPNIEKKVPESEQNESTCNSPRSESSSSICISSPLKDEDGLEFNKAKQNESTIDIPPSELPSSLIISSPAKSRVSSYCEEQAQVEPEYTNMEKKVLEFEQNESTFEYLDTETDGSDDSLSENSDTLNSDVEETSVGDHNKKTKNTKVVSEKNDTATKLKFKKVNMAEIESYNSNSRRLSFRRGRVLGEDQEKNKNQSRSFAKRGGGDNINGRNDDSEKVVLRHQKVEGKKDSQGLFNNVIEETASKLVETRKSKVKALVGAFETVISLQESKPATQNTLDEK